jgi:riboflavin kinase / FMN adenylyltransferase
MRLLRGFTDPDSYRGGYVAIGNFDGVHRGHQKMVSALVEQARGEEVPAVVMTFDPHPITLLAPGQVPPSLSTLERKAELIEKLGVDVLIAYPTDRALLDLAPEEFFRRILRRELNARGLVEGPNFFFGRDRAGDIELLGKLCRDEGMSLTIVEPVLSAVGTLVSSSAIRKAIGEGRIAEAVIMLGHPYRLTGTVESGARRGTGLGFPTANLSGIGTLLPADGVYAGQSPVDGTCYPAAVHLGPNLTFHEGDRKLEIHLVGYQGDLYGRRLSVDLLDRVRDIMRFEDLESLRSQLAADVELVRRKISKDHGV